MENLPVFLEDAARCEVRGHTVHFIWDELDLALPLSTCLANMRECERAIEEWRVREKTSVLPFHRSGHG